MGRYRSTLTAFAVLGCMAWVMPTVGVAEEVTIYRDDFGVPHIYAATDAGACYGAGYAQAEDRLEELLKQFRRCTGTMSEAFGPEHLAQDRRQRLWRHAEIAREKYSELEPRTRAAIEAYLAGIQRYMSEHPDKVPEWAPKLEPSACVALGRYIIWGWPEGDAGGDLKKAGIEPDPVAAHGSNQWIVAPQRTTDGAAIALIDPHLQWFGPFRWYEMRLYGDTIQFSGVAILGMPLPVLGHSQYCSIAMTTGGPDAADCYEESLNPQNPRQYQYDGKWRDLTFRDVDIAVKEEDGVHNQTFEIAESHHGPIVATKNGKAYAMKLPYYDQVRLYDQIYGMLTARNLDEMKESLRLLQFMEQNIMVGTVDGDIFYVRNGRVPVRAPGFNYKRPLAGDTSETEWRGIHPLEDLAAVQNPPAGFMQNCNCSAQFLTKDCPLTAAAFSERPYLFNYDYPLHPRAAMVFKKLDETPQMSVDNAKDIALCYEVFNADIWQGLLRSAWANGGSTRNAELARAYAILDQWDRRCDPQSNAAVLYRYWKDEFPQLVKLGDMAGMPPPRGLSDAALLDNLERAAAKMLADYKRLDIPFGDVYRVGRPGHQHWPVGGGDVAGIVTPRKIVFETLSEDDKTYIGVYGQSATQIVQLTRPPRSWSITPHGQSDDPNSPHFDDQAKKLFSPGQFKPTYFLDKEALMRHVEPDRTRLLVWNKAEK